MNLEVRLLGRRSFGDPGSLVTRAERDEVSWYWRTHCGVRGAETPGRDAVSGVRLG